MKKELEKKLKQVEELLVHTNIDFNTYDFYDKLLSIHSKLLDLIYFDTNQREDFLDNEKDKM